MIQTSVGLTRWTVYGVRGTSPKGVLKTKLGFASDSFSSEIKLPKRSTSNDLRMSMKIVLDFYPRCGTVFVNKRSGSRAQVFPL